MLIISVKKITFGTMKILTYLFTRIIPAALEPGETSVGLGPAQVEPGKAPIEPEPSPGALSGSHHWFHDAAVYCTLIRLWLLPSETCPASPRDVFPSSSYFLLPSHNLDWNCIRGKDGLCSVHMSPLFFSLSPARLAQFGHCNDTCFHLALSAEKGPVQVWKGK